MRELFCYYHPDRKADEKCETCQKLLCLECKKVLRIAHTRHHSSSTSSSISHTYYTRHDVCPECYYDRQIAMKSPYKFIFLAVMLTIILIIMPTISYVMLDLNHLEWAHLIFIIPIVLIPVVIGIVSYYIRVRLPRAKKQLIAEKAEFLKSVGIEPELEAQRSPIARSEGNTGSCPNCGQQIESDDKFCENCGREISQ